VKKHAILAGVALSGLMALAASAQPSKAVPDIWVSQIKTDKTTFRPGETFMIRVTVQNRGTAVAPGSSQNGYMVDLSLATSAAGFPATSHVLPSPYHYVSGMLLRGGRISHTYDLAPGAAREYAARVELPAKMKPGTYWVGITCDPFNRLNETQPYPQGENDNVTNIDIRIEAPRPTGPLLPAARK